MTNQQKLEKHIAERVEGLGLKSITLEDVLIAYETKHGNIMINYASGYDIKINIVSILIKWELGKPLSKQSQQTINFLLEIFENE